MAGSKERQDEEKGWTPQEKARGAPLGEAGEAGAAGAAEPKGRPSDDRAETESAAAEVQQSPAPGTRDRKP